MPFELSERSKVSCRLHGSFTAFPNQGQKKSRTNPCPGRSKESAIPLYTCLVILGQKLKCKIKEMNSSCESM